MWVCFIITYTLFTSPVTFHVTASEPTETQRACQQTGQRDIRIPHGEELLIVTECVKIPSRNKT